MYKRNTAADRTTVLRKIAFFYGLFAFLIWGNVTWSYFDDSGDIWQQIPRTSTALYLGLGATVCLAFVIWGLWTAKRWAWGAALACLAIPVFGAVIIAYGKLMAGMSFILWYYFFYYCVPALHEAAPKTTFIPESMMNDIDCIAAELGVRWQDHFLYHCLELVYAKDRALPPVCIDNNSMSPGMKPTKRLVSGSGRKRN